MTERKGLTEKLDHVKPMGKRQLQAYRTKQKIMEAGERLIIEKGFESVTIRDIASECSIALGTMYHYFRSKEDLFLYINQSRYAAKYEELLSKSSSTSMDSFFQFIDTWFDFVSNDNLNYTRQWFILSFENKIPLSEKGLNRMEEDVCYISSFLKQAIANGEFSSEAPLDEIVQDMVFSMYGAVTLYCLKNADYDLRAWNQHFQEQCKRRLEPYYLVKE